MKERYLLLVRFIGTHFVLPLLFVFLSAVLPKNYFIFNCIGQTILLLVYLCGYWEFTTQWFKYLTLSLFELLFIILLIVKFQSPVQVDYFIFSAWLGAVFELFLLVRVINAIRSICRKTNDDQEIIFPFGPGKYLITDGGDSKVSRLMNYHFYSPIHRRMRTNNSMRFAVDIVQLKNGKGNHGFFPLRNEDYFLFNEPVLSPVNGQIFKIISEIPDNDPYTGNYPYNSGNSIVIKSGEYYFVLGHLKQNSIQVKEGDMVKQGDTLALAGNSGWTERPHLHMQLIFSEDEDYWHGRGINIQYKGINLYKNRTITVI
jgi:hypothetical protein